MRAKLCNMSHLSVQFVTLVIQSGAMAKFWPLHHFSQCMGENRRIYTYHQFAYLVGEGRVNPIFTTHLAKDAS